MFTAVIAVLLWEKLVCTGLRVSLNGWGGAPSLTAMLCQCLGSVRRKRLVQRLSDRGTFFRVLVIRNYQPLVLDIRMVSGNTMVQCNFIFFTFEKPWLTPTELVHLFRERVLSKNLFSTAVSLARNFLAFEIPTAPTRSNENGRPSLYALRTFLSLIRGKARTSTSALVY